MAKQILNTGLQPNDGSGDGLRTGGEKINSNFNEVYSLLGDGTNLLSNDIDFGPNKLLHSNSVTNVGDLQDINVNTYNGLVVLVQDTGALYYAHSGRWFKLLADNSANNVVNYQDNLKTVSYTGDYNDLQNRPSVPTDLTDLSGIVDGNAGQALITDGTGNFTFRDITASTIEFGNITNKPTTIAGYGIQDAFDGDYANLSNKPAIFSGDYGDLENAPTIPVDLSDLTDNTSLLFDGEYLSLTGRPTIPSDINQLNDTQGLLFGGSYADLTNKPTSFSGLTALSMGLGISVDEFSNDASLEDASTTTLPTEFAVKSYIDNRVLDAGISLTDLGVVVNSVGTADLSYNNTSGIFTYTPPDLSSYLTSVAFADLTSTPTTLAGYGITDSPTTITDLGISDGGVGQVLTTNGAGSFTFQDPGDQIGNFTLAASIIDTDDSSAITITPAVVMSSDLTVQNDIIVNNDLRVNGDIVTGTVGDPEIVSESDILLTAATRVTVTQSPFKLASFTDSERDALTAENGDMIYNTTNNRPEMYVNGAWKIVDTSPIV